MLLNVHVLLAFVQIITQGGRFQGGTILGGDDMGESTVSAKVG